MGDLASQFVLPLQGKLAIVTGSSHGIRADIAWELARHDNSKLIVEELRTKVTQLPQKPITWACQAGLSTTTDAREIISQLKTCFGSDELQIHILVNNNAAIEVVSDIQSMTLGNYETVFNLNVRGLMLITQAMAAVEGFTRSWASELGGDGTTVNAVAPGPTTMPVEQQLGTTEEIASIVGWLAGPDASWVSGQVICASGAWSM
ncbi:Short-chain dehydrogenase/reductase SDR [Penicillium odoratum]|uniref:Short-chain dehydrogenase/reductase SDR n=1 Tax=Penicillium odoratum TaxID=1167516 RepID=UPI0025479482|nr:Short-chain dehydrogenase/reductase SDR [Penicillium odoratum]KAJ5771621.1 Short-chain dehydrogenase/reductase SDR [Penicillium odoratum]